jgi:predicted RNA-binding protein with PUA-like domain
METPTGRGPRRPTTTAAAARTRSRAPQKGAAIAARNLIVDLQEGGVPFLYSSAARTPG